MLDSLNTAGPFVSFLLGYAFGSAVTFILLVLAAHLMRKPCPEEPPSA